MGNFGKVLKNFTYSNAGYLLFNTKFAFKLYRPLKIRVALTAVETWTQGDKIMVDEDSDKSLQNFMKYRNSDLVKKYPHDNAQLLT